MSDPESFLARWTRLKREAEDAARTSATHEPSRQAEDTPSESASIIEGAEPTVDLSALPPIDEITATTDIRGYLAPGVPDELTRAALRRAWLADPTIRDFVGIAENQWDFNDPHGVPGFGPIEDVGRLIGQILGGEEGRAAPPSGNAPFEAPQSVAPLPEAPQSIDKSGTVAAAEPEPTALAEPNMSVRQPLAPLQQADRGRSAEHVASPRAHGSALPK